MNLFECLCGAGFVRFVWHCPSCDEHNDLAEDECWLCERLRPAAAGDEGSRAAARGDLHAEGIMNDCEKCGHPMAWHKIVSGRRRCHDWDCKCALEVPQTLTGVIARRMQ